MILVNPSSRAAAIEVHYTSPADGKLIKLSNEDELPCIAGETVAGLSTYSVYFTLSFLCIHKYPWLKTGALLQKTFENTCCLHLDQGVQ